ncbi:MAG: VWA domain-containing protein [Candidatus Binatia bacterium]
MKSRIAELVTALRGAGMAVSVAEAMDAARAAAVAGIERPVLREALAATLVKDEDDRPAFLLAFARVFPAEARAVAREARDKKARRSGAAEGDGGGASSAGAASGSGAGTPGEGSTAGQPARPRSSPGSEARPEATRMARRAEQGHDADADREREGDGEAFSPDRARALRTRELVRRPVRALTATEVEECATLVAALAARVRARVRRRLAPKKTGRLDFRRTIRAAVPRGGVPFERLYRGRRPGRPDLVVLCDVSASTAIATGFFLALLAPAAEYFRRVRLFGYVDRLVEIEYVAGQMRPAAPIDLMARSDFGRVLRDLDAVPALLGADTVLLVLGDARNNRLPPRADLLAAARVHVRRIVWLNPEPRERWDTGDSVIAAYARHADVVVECGTLAELERAVGEAAK